MFGGIYHSLKTNTYLIKKWSCNGWAHLYIYVISIKKNWK